MTPPPPPPSYGVPAYGAPMSGASPMGSIRYAGWWQRVGATIIDGLITVVFLAPAIVVLFAGPTEVNFREDGLEGPGFYEEPSGATIGLAVLLYFLGFGIYIALYCRRVAKQGSSWGMSATGYRIMYVPTGGNITVARSVGRFFARYLSYMPCNLGLLWPLWDAENRTFHDMIVQTRAVRK